MESSGPEQPQKQSQGETPAQEDVGSAKPLGAEGASGATRPTPDLSRVFKRVTVTNEEHLLQQPSVMSSPGVTEMQRSTTAEIFPVTGPSSSSSDGGFTQAFEALKQDGSRPKREPYWDGYGHNTQGSGEGEFTRLFQRADGGRSGPVRENQILPPEHEVRPFTQEVGGGFTQLLRTLSNEADVAMPPSATRPPVQPVVEGPGEFTQIVSRSMLREGGSRPEKEGIPEGVARPQSQAGEPAYASPGSAGNVQLPHPMIGSAAAAGLEIGRQTTPLGTGMPVSLPPVLPRDTPVQPVAGRLQQYVPLLLIANLFAMVLLLVLAGFALLRHH